jgi:hypothetical protein
MVQYTGTFIDGDALDKYYKFRTQEKWVLYVILFMLFLECGCEGGRKDVKLQTILPVQHSGVDGERRWWG